MALTFGLYAPTNKHKATQLLTTENVESLAYSIYKSISYSRVRKYLNRKHIQNTFAKRTKPQTIIYISVNQTEPCTFDCIFRSTSRRLQDFDLLQVNANLWFESRWFLCTLNVIVRKHDAVFDGLIPRLEAEIFNSII